MTILLGISAGAGLVFVIFFGGMLIFSGRKRRK